MRLELWWGGVRRSILRTLFPGYVASMQAKRKGTSARNPDEFIDSRDTKYFQNVCDYHWDRQDDPVAWRDKLPFARAGLAELVIMTTCCWTAIVVLGLIWWPAAIVPLVIWLLIVWFFRDPHREVPTGPGILVSPADGKIVTIEKINDEFVGPAYLIGIFLSVFNVHINRAPCQSVIIGQTYRPGKFLNALLPKSAQENEQLETRLEQTHAPFYRFRVRQIAGAIARRIVCYARPGQVLNSGEKYGMIKVGSRTELVLPDVPDLKIEVVVGQKVRAGETVLVRFSIPTDDLTRRLAHPEVSHAATA